MTRRLAKIAVVAGSLCIAGCSDALLGPRPSADNAALFDEVWRQFDLHYSFFELKGINWDSLGAHYRPQAVGASSSQALASVLSRMLTELKDPHVSLTAVGMLGTMRYSSPTEIAPTYFDADAMLRQYLPTAQTTSGGHVRYGMLTPGVGYLRIASFEGSGWASEVDDALAQMRNASRMIVDVRGNLGGRYALAADVAGRFADKSRVFGYVRYRNGPKHSDFTGYNEETVSPSGVRQFTGPVYVLTNRRVASSGEDFVMAMAAMPTSVVVGDTTAGASGGPIVRDLPNGWTYQLSEWIEYNRDKQTFEGRGLIPSVVVKASAGDMLTNTDAALEQAMALAKR